MIAPDTATSPRVLLVDDSAERTGRENVLTGAGYAVESALTLEAASRQWRLYEPDLILLAINEDQSGAFRWMREMHMTRPLQQIAMLLTDRMQLCEVRQDGRVVLAAEGPEDLLLKVRLLMQDQETEKMLRAAGGR